MTFSHTLVSAVADAGNAGEIEPSHWNANHNMALADSATWVDPGRTILASTNRLSLAGTARLTIQPESNMTLRGGYGLGSLQIVDGQWLLQYKRAALAGNARATLVGASDLFIFDLAPVNRLVLAGGPS